MVPTMALVCAPNSSRCNTATAFICYQNLKLYIFCCCFILFDAMCVCVFFPSVSFNEMFVNLHFIAFCRAHILFSLWIYFFSRLLLHLNTSWCFDRITVIFIYIYGYEANIWLQLYFVSFFLCTDFFNAISCDLERISNWLWKRPTCELSDGLINMNAPRYTSIACYGLLKWISNQWKNYISILWGGAIQQHFVAQTVRAIWKCTQEQDCLQLNEQINTAFIRLIALSTDNFQVQLNEPISHDIPDGVNSRPNAPTSTMIYFISKWKELLLCKRFVDKEQQKHQNNINLQHVGTDIHTHTRSSAHVAKRFRANKLWAF